MRKAIGALVTAGILGAAVITTGLPASANVTTVSINDNSTGTGGIAYTGSWRYQSGYSTHYRGDNHFSWVKDSTATLTFTGTKVAIYGSRAADFGKFGVDIDGVRVATVDAYSATRSDGRLLWTSTTLKAGTHRVKLRVLGHRRAASKGTTVSLDRFLVTPTTTVTPTPTPTPTTPVVRGKRSGLPWVSGVQTHDVAKMTRFESFRGRKADVVVGFVARESWEKIVGSDWLYDAFRGVPDLQVVLSIPPIPEDSGSTMAGCAAGAYDARWREIATKLKSKGLENAIIRLGWEFSGNWYKWSAHDPEQFKRCWIRVHNAAESVAPGLKWDWNPNRGTSQSNALAAYPGNAYVDIVGVDTYDQWPPARDELSWQRQFTESGLGLKNYADFARANGKKLSVPEWGVAHFDPNSVNTGGDNPFYVRKMAEFFRANADLIAYESYFESEGSPATGNHDLLNGSNPKAAAEYLRQYG